MCLFFLKIQNLKSQLKDKDKHIERIEVSFVVSLSSLFLWMRGLLVVAAVIITFLAFFQRDYMTDRLSWEREEKLVVSAWYEMVGGVPF